MLIADLKQNPNATFSTFSHVIAGAKESVSGQLKSLGIEDASDLATVVGYLIVSAYGLAMVLNLGTRF